MKRLVHQVQSHLTDDLRRAPYKGSENPMTGHCYVASEVLAHVLGPDWKPCFVRHEGAPHWFLRNQETGKILDATASQFKTPVPYEQGVGKGFLTKNPSARAKVVLNQLAKAA